MAKRKTTMVQVPPTRVKAGDQSTPSAESVLADLLKKIGNDRAYTFIKKDGNAFIVWFEGDSHETRLSPEE